jgi:hypothetical protein
VTFHVTPSLMLGEIPPRLTLARRIHNADEALATIRDGRIAVLKDDWTLVPIILRALGLTDDEIKSRIALARSGETDILRS